MQYMGGKYHMAKHILPIVEQHRLTNQVYVEPFMGGANVIWRVAGRRIGADIHSYLIAMWVAVQSGWIPPTSVNEDTYYHIKQNPDEDPKLTGFIGFACSYGGKWFGGYARDNNGRNYALNGHNVILKQAAKMPPSQVEILNCSYQDLVFPDGSLIYCDPPYRNTTKYTHDFDSDQFWDVAKFWARQGHSVLVSENSAPLDPNIEIVLDVKSVRSLDYNGITANERLYRVKG